MLSVDIKDCNHFANEIYESTECSKCEKGKFTTGTHTIYCLNCPAGYYIETEGNDFCGNVRR